MRQNFFLMLVFLSMIPALTFTQCKEVPKRELMMLDTLDTIIIRTRESLSYDLITLNNRKIRMDADRNLVTRFYADTVDIETGNMMTKYKAIGKVYANFIGNYQNVQNAMKKSEKQSQSLRNSVLDHKLTKEEFKTYYSEEKELALQNLNKAREISQNIPEMEPEYQRLSRQMDELLSMISERIIQKEQDSSLYKILQQRAE